MNDCFWVVFTILFHQITIAYFILLDVSYILMSAVRIFPQIFSSAQFGCYVDREQIVLWYEED